MEVRAPSARLQNGKGVAGGSRAGTTVHKLRRLPWPCDTSAAAHAADRSDACAICRLRASRRAHATQHADAALRPVRARAGCDAARRWLCDAWERCRCLVPVPRRACEERALWVRSRRAPATTANGACARRNMRAWRRETGAPCLTLFALTLRSNSAGAGAAAALRVCAATTSPKQSRGAEKRAQARAARHTANALLAAQRVESPSRVLAPPRRRRRPRQACTRSRCVGCRRRTARQARRKASTLRCSPRQLPLCRLCCTRRRTRCVSRSRARSVGTRRRTNPRAHARCADSARGAGQRPCHRRDRA